MAKPIEEKVVLYNTSTGIKKGTNLSSFQVGKLVVNQTKALTPVDEGTLRNSYMVISNSGETSGFNNGGGEKADKELKDLPPNASAHVGTALEYATYIEFGTKNSQSQPHLRPSIELVAGSSSVKNVVQKYFTREIEKSTKMVEKTTVTKK